MWKILMRSLFVYVVRFAVMYDISMIPGLVVKRNFMLDFKKFVNAFIVLYV